MATDPYSSWGTDICNWNLLVSNRPFTYRGAIKLIVFPTSRFGWTGFTPKIHWAAPTVAGIFIGFGVLCVFLPCFNYLVDSYLQM